MGSHSVTYTFNVDQGVYALAIMLVCALAALSFIISGALLITHRRERSRWLTHEQMARDLAQWNRGLTQTAAQQSEILLQLTALVGWATLGAGVGWLLAIVGVCALALGVTHTLASLIATGANILIVLLFQGAALGMTLGFLFGSWRATHRLPASPTYADLRRRQPSDYQAAWLAWGPGVMAPITLGPLWLLATQTAHVSLTLGDGRWNFPTGTIVAVCLGLSVLIPVATALCVRWLVASPRTLLATDPLAARGADDYRRAVAIGSVLGLEWMSSGCLLQSVMSIATTNGVGGGQPFVASMLTVIYFLGVGATITGLFVIALHGRLGGHLTGWRRPTARPDATPVGDGELAHE